MVISVNEQEMQDFLEKVMFDIRCEFFTHSTELKHYNLSEKELGEETVGRGMGNYYSQSDSDYGSKKANHHINPNFSNGLPRKR